MQCPRGTFHNKALNSCQLCKIGYYNDQDGQVDCIVCPAYQSTRKLGAKSKEECIGTHREIDSCLSIQIPIYFTRFSAIFRTMSTRYNGTSTTENQSKISK